MKKAILAMLLCVATLGAKAQFEAGTKYVGASLSGLGLSYGSNQRLNIGLQATAGYFIFDSWLLKANVGYTHTRATDDVSLGLGARYYFTQNGIFAGAGAEYIHATPSSNDIAIPVEIGYAFYLNRYITFEPSVYYKMSLNDFSGGSKVGLNIGLGFYF